MKGFLYVTLILLVAIKSSVDMVGLLSENRVRPCACVCLCTGVTLTIQWRDRNSPSLCEPYIAPLPPHAFNICKQWSQQHNNNIYYKLSRLVSFRKTPTHRLVLANQTLYFTCTDKKFSS